MTRGRISRVARWIMAKFVFRLEALLEQRSHAEREKQLSLAQVERQRADLESRISEAQRQIRSNKEEMRGLLSGESGGIDPRSIRVQAASAMHAQAMTQRLVLQLAGVYQRVSAARDALQRATTQRRAVELLKQKQFDAWRRERARAEQSQLDEIGMQAHARRRADGSV